MKKILLAVCIFTNVILQAQTPQAFKYQSIVRNVEGNPMASSAISIRATVHDGSATGTSVYQETHSVNTNQFGLINLEIGNGTAVNGTFPTIVWGTGTKWMEIEADFGSGYVPMGTSQLISVPYALNCGNSIPGPAGTTGLTGSTGATGSQGITGAIGAAGTNGMNGTVGSTGAIGSQGIAGATGSTGAAGINGTNGVNGIIGATGSTGLTGSAGTNGMNGTNGIDGAVGTAGPTGTNGTNGTNGIDGAVGAAGSAGTNGTNGTNGIDGAVGTAGSAGTNGTNGTNGIDGAVGAAGSAGTNGTNGTNGIDGAVGATGAAGTNGTNGTNGIDGAVGAAGSAGTNGTNGTNGIDGAVGAAGAVGPTGATGSILQFAMFYGLTAGIGNGAATDYPATIVVKTVAGTGRVPFPRNGPAAGIVRVDNTSFTLSDIGTYEITFGVQTTEEGQLQLELNGVDLPETVVANMNPTSGGHPIIGDFFITTTAANSILVLVNSSGNAAPLTITPADGANTHANAQNLTIKKIF